MPKKIRKKQVMKQQKPKAWIYIAAAFLILIIASILIQLSQKSCANAVSCISDLSGEYDTKSTTGEFLGQQVLSPVLASTTPESVVLGDETGEDKRIEIDLTNQRLYAFEENKVVYEFPISSGKWGKTPTGDFRIWIKLRYTRMTGGNRALGTYYNLPNVPYTMFFYNDETPKSLGFGIHGAYWHNNFGHPMSHGCINMREEDVAKIYNWAHPVAKGGTTYADDEDMGTPIKIYGESST